MTDRETRIREHAWRRILAGEDDTESTFHRPTTDEQRDNIRREALRTAHLQALGAGLTRPEIDAAELDIRRRHLTNDASEHLLDVGRRYLAALQNDGPNGPPPGAEDYRRCDGTELR
jgi:hypothetical protein